MRTARESQIKGRSPPSTGAHVAHSHNRTRHVPVCLAARRHTRGVSLEHHGAMRGTSAPGAALTIHFELRGLFRDVIKIQNTNTKLVQNAHPRGGQTGWGGGLAHCRGSTCSPTRPWSRAWARLAAALRCGGPSSAPSRRRGCASMAAKMSQPRFKEQPHAGLFRAYAYPAPYPEGTRSTRIS